MAKKGIVQRIAAHIAERLKPTTILKEATQTVTDKVVPLGAAELAHGLIGNADGRGGPAFVPYGSSQRPLDVAGPGQSYNQAIRDAAARASQQQDRSMGMDR